MSPVWMLQEARSSFTELVNRACTIEPQIVTRHGKPIVVVIPYETYQRESKPKSSLVDFMQSAALEVGELSIPRSQETARGVAL